MRYRRPAPAVSAALGQVSAASLPPKAPTTPVPPIPAPVEALNNTAAALPRPRPVPQPDESDEIKAPRDVGEADDEVSPPRRRRAPTAAKAGFDVLELVGVMLGLVYLAFIALVYFGVIWPPPPELTANVGSPRVENDRNDSAPGDDPRRRPGDEGKPGLVDVHDLPPRDAAVEARLAAQRQTKLAEIRANELKVVESLAKTDAATAGRRGQLATLRGARAYNVLTFSPDATLLFTGSGNRVTGNDLKVWDLKTGKIKFDLSKTPSPVLCASFSPDGQTLAAGCEDQTIRLFEMQTGTMIRSLTGHTHEVRGIAFSPDRRWLASGGSAGFQGERGFFLWNMPTAQPAPIAFPGIGSVGDLEFRPDSRVIAVGSYLGPVSLWEVASGKRYRQSFADVKGAQAFAFSPDGWTLAVGGGQPRTSADGGTLRLYDLASGKNRELKPDKQPMGLVRSAAFTPDGKVLVTGDDPIRLWDVERNKMLMQIKSDPVRTLAISPSGLMLAIVSGGEVVLWCLPDLIADEAPKSPE